MGLDLNRFGQVTGIPSPPSFTYVFQSGARWTHHQWGKYKIPASVAKILEERSSSHSSPIAKVPLQISLDLTPPDPRRIVNEIALPTSVGARHSGQGHLNSGPSGRIPKVERRKTRTGIQTAHHRAMSAVSALEHQKRGDLHLQKTSHPRCQTPFLPAFGLSSILGFCPRLWGLAWRRALPNRLSPDWPYRRKHHVRKFASRGIGTTSTHATQGRCKTNTPNRGNKDSADRDKRVFCTEPMPCSRWLPPWTPFDDMPSLSAWSADLCRTTWTHRRSSMLPESGQNRRHESTDRKQQRQQPQFPMISHWKSTFTAHFPLISH